jgi:hypothetical protein
MKRLFKRSVLLLAMMLVSPRAFTQEIVNATSEDIAEFDRLLEKNAEPKPMKKDEKKDASKKDPSGEASPRDSFNRAPPGSGRTPIGPAIAPAPGGRKDFGATRPPDLNGTQNPPPAPQPPPHP